MKIIDIQYYWEFTKAKFVWWVNIFHQKWGMSQLQSLQYFNTFKGYLFIIAIEIFVYAISMALFDYCHG